MGDKELINIRDYSQYIYEAAFVALNIGYFAGKNTIPETVLTALKRILDYAGIYSKASANDYIISHDTSLNKDSAHMLLENLRNRESFFDSLTDNELHLYHSANHDISKEYGRYLASLIDFNGMSIADIGGSSGGLLSGVKEKASTSRLCVFDTPEACKAGELLSTGIDFTPCDFFTFNFESMAFDTVIFSNILHDWHDSDCIRLLANTSCILKKAKYVIIHEDLLFNDGNEPAEAIMYGLRLSINVPGGRQRTISQMKALLNEACGCPNVLSIYNFGPLSAIVLAFLGA